VDDPQRSGHRSLVRRTILAIATLQGNRCEASGRAGLLGSIGGGFVRRGAARKTFLAGVAMDYSEGARRVTAGTGSARACAAVRQELFAAFGAELFRSYIDPLRLVAELDGVLLFRAGTQVAKERLKQQVQHRLEARLRVYEPRISATEILLESEIPEDVRDLADVRIEDARSAAPALMAHPQSFTFDTFCCDASNQ